MKNPPFELTNRIVSDVAEIAELVVRKRGRGLQGKAEDAGGLTRAKDDNAAMQFPDR